MIRRYSWLFPHFIFCFWYFHVRFKQGFQGLAVLEGYFRRRWIAGKRSFLGIFDGVCPALGYPAKVEDF